MKTTCIVILTTTLAILTARGSSLEEVLQNIDRDYSFELFHEEVEKAEASMDPQTIVDETVAFLLSSRSADGEALAVDFIIALKTFPFSELCDRFNRSSTSTERAYTLRLLGYGEPHQINSDTLKRLASTVLYDRGSGLRRYGEGRAYSPEGSRLCDVAYNTLVFEYGLMATFPLVEVDNYSEAKRDRLIEKLGVELNLPPPPSW